MKHKGVFIMLLLASTACQTTVDQQNNLQAILAEYQSFQDEQFPEDNLIDLSDAAVTKRYEFYDSLLQQVNALSIDDLDTSEIITQILLAYTLQNKVDEFSFHMHENGLLTDGGFHINLTYMPGSLPFLTIEDYENYLGKLSNINRYTDQNIALLQKGIANKIIQPRVIFNGYEDTYEAHIVDEPEKSIFFKPFTDFPVDFADSIKQELQQRGRQIISTIVVPSYERIKQFFEQEYFPVCRSTIGSFALPDGKEFYVNRIKYFTTLPLSADSIHALGQVEVARIKKEMQVIIDSLKFKGSFKEFLYFLRTDDQFYSKTPLELLKEATYIAKTMDGKLPSLFGRLPRLTYTVEPVPDFLAPKYTGGRYIEPPKEGRGPGKYWVNTYNLQSRPLYVLTALTLHEAVPGHHLNIALTMELEHLPKFRKSLYLSAFGEGWGLYSEFLGVEAGMYHDPYSNFGRLTYEMWRACRLVVDTGIHAFGWSRQQAIDFLAENTALSLHEITTEVDRYIAWPAQALAYKIGELKIKSLRKKTENALGEKFDVREFHDVILSEGSVTLPILEQMVASYINTKEKSDSY